MSDRMIDELAKLHEENDRLREYIAASKECAEAGDLLELQERHDKLKSASVAMVAAIREESTVKLGSCPWCGDLWPQREGATIDEVQAEYQDHDRACAKNPLRIERDALRTAVIDVADLQLRRSDLLVQISAYRQAANDLREPFSDAKVERLVEEWTKDDACRST